MVNEKRLIELGEALRMVMNSKYDCPETSIKGRAIWDTAHNCALSCLTSCNAVDAVEVIRCQNCVHAEPLDRNCEINTCHYMHCKLYRGEETKNVWHKYKKYYKDYSLVERDGFCSDGAKMDGDGNA